MGRCFRALEQSLEKIQRRSAKSKQGQRSMQIAAAEGMSTLASPKLQEQIDVIRGRRVAQPTRSLRMLEDRVMGRMPSARPPRETLRLDHGQVAPPPSDPSRMTVPPIAPDSMAVVPWSGKALNASPPVLAAANPYSPEFSAPDTGRFEVESFDSGPAPPGDLFRSVTPESTTPADYKDESTGWLTQTKSEQPNKITAASKKSLDSSLALAKDDFERDLASILGQPIAPAAPPQDSLFNATPPTGPAPAVPPQPSMPNSNAPPPHPNHDVFDQMGLAMRYANSFDLGNINLNDRFKRFERELELPTKVPDRNVAASVSNPFVDPMSLDEFDLVAELAEIGSERLAVQPPPPRNIQQNLTDSTEGEDHDQPIG